MVTGNSHRPSLVPIIQLPQKTCGISDVLGRIEHILQGGKFRAVIHEVDLHAADVDQLCPLPPRRGNLSKGFLQRTGKECLAFDIQCKGTERAFSPSLGEADRIEYAFRNAILCSSVLYLSFACKASADRSFSLIRDKRCRDEYQRRQNPRLEPNLHPYLRKS